MYGFLVKSPDGSSETASLIRSIKLKEDNGVILAVVEKLD